MLWPEPSTVRSRCGLRHFSRLQVARTKRKSCCCSRETEGQLRWLPRRLLIQRLVVRRPSGSTSGSCPGKWVAATEFVVARAPHDLAPSGARGTEGKGHIPDRRLLRFPSRL